MQDVCHLRLYTDDDRLITGRPRIFKASDHKASETNAHHNPPVKAMTSQTTAMPDINLHPRKYKKKNLKQHDLMDYQENSQRTYERSSPAHNEQDCQQSQTFPPTPLTIRLQTHLR